jgi:hypothetical protein
MCPKKTAQYRRRYRQMQIVFEQAIPEKMRVFFELKPHLNGLGRRWVKIFGGCLVFEDFPN